MIRVKNLILPYEALTNYDLINAVKDLKIKCFCGVYLMDTLPGKPNKKECGILNLDSSGGPGTHWVAWYKNGNNKIYFDSYGIQPPKEIIKYLGKGIEYNTDQLQPRETVFCGHMCLFVLKDLYEGVDFQTIINKFY